MRMRGFLYWETVSVCIRSSFQLRRCANICCPLCNIHMWCSEWGWLQGTCVLLEARRQFVKAYNMGEAQLINKPLSVMTLNQLLLTKTNHTGSDVRIYTGEFLNPRQKLGKALRHLVAVGALV